MSPIPDKPKKPAEQITDASAPLTSELTAAGRSWQLLLLTLAMSAAAYAAYALTPLQEAMRHALSLSDNQIALLQGPVQSLPVLVAAIPVGLLIDRFSRVRLLFLFALLYVGASLLTASASNFTTLLVARAMIGLAVASSLPAFSSLLADWYPPAQLGRANMVLGIGASVGISAAFGLGGALLSRTGSAPDGWQWSMFYLTAPLIVIAVLILRMTEPPRTGRILKNPSTTDSFAEFWLYRAVVMPVLAAFVMQQVALNVVQVWTVSSLARSFRLEPDRVGAIMAMASLASGILGPILGGILADACQRKGGPHRTLGALSMLVLASLPASLYAVMSSLVVSSALLVVFMTALAAIGVMVTTVLTIVVPNEIRGFCLSVTAGVCVVFGSIAPLVSSVLSGFIGGPSTIGKASAAVCLSSGIFAAMLFALGRHYILRRRQPNWLDSSDVQRASSRWTSVSTKRI